MSCLKQFNRMTIVAAIEVIADCSSHSEMEVLEVQWDIQDYVSTSNKAARIADWAKAAIQINPDVMTENGQVKLERALIDAAILAPPAKHNSSQWQKLLAGLRFDGFELTEVDIPSGKKNWRGEPVFRKGFDLRRMLPSDVPETDFREAASEIETLLDQLGLSVAKGHLRQALSAYQRGEWSSANGELRNFYENYLNEIADALGYDGKDESKLRRDFLGSDLSPPFLLEEYNEWHPQKTQFVQGLMNRMHPHGGHPGLSEEEDATFRLQVQLITARLFLRRFKQRKSN